MCGCYEMIYAGAHVRYRQLESQLKSRRGAMWGLEENIAWYNQEKKLLVSITVCRRPALLQTFNSFRRTKRPMYFYKEGLWFLPSSRLFNIIRVMVSVVKIGVKIATYLNANVNAYAPRARYIF